MTVMEGMTLVYLSAKYQYGLVLNKVLVFDIYV